MFHDYDHLNNIDELKYLDTKNVKDFSFMFNFCRELKDIKALIIWLNDVSHLKNWNVSNENNFQNKFPGYVKLANIKPLEKLDVSNVKNFNKCSSIVKLYQI